MSSRYSALLVLRIYRQEKLAILDVILCQILAGNNRATLSSDGSLFNCGFKATDSKDCFAILISIPIPIIENNKDDPPELTKGKGMPLVGTMPETTAMLIIACNPNITVIPNPKKIQIHPWLRVLSLIPATLITRRDI